MMSGSRRLKDRWRGHAPVQRLEPAMIAGRVPPHDLDAEAAVLSAILLSRDALDRVLEILKTEHFYSDANKLVYDAAIELSQTGTPIDIVSVASWLRDRERLAQIGGPGYLAQLSDATPAVAHVGAHAAVVYEKWRVRQMIATCQRVAAEGYGDTGQVDQWLETSEASVFEVVHAPGRVKSTLLGPLVKNVFQRMYDAAERGEKITGLPTGFDKIDAKTSGLYDGDLTLVAGRPGMGKTSFVLNIAVNTASPREVVDRDAEGRAIERTLLGDGVAVFSLEMPKEQLTQRMLCSEARVDLGRMRNGLLTPTDWRALTDASTYLASLPIWVDDTPAISLLTLRAKIRRIQAEYNRAATATTPERRVGLVVIDYLQLMTGRDGVNSREQEIGEISRGLKALAKELKVPVIALSQLNRAAETRSTKDKRPQLSDLRESGSLEQDADNVFLLYRDEYYNPESKYKGIAEVNIAKQRNGPTGKVYLRLYASCTRFDNLELSEYPSGDDD